MDFLRIFLEDFRGPRKTVFVFKSRAQKVQVIMACCGPNFQSLVFIPKTDKLLLWHLKWKGKHKQMLLSLRLQVSFEYRSRI